MFYICGMKLFLDDIRQPRDVFNLNIDFDYSDSTEGWTIVRTYDEFVDHIKKFGVPDLISFDHDLSFSHYLSENQKNINYKNMEVKTGYHAACWLVSYCKENGINLPKTKIHSQNPDGSKNISEILNQFRSQHTP